MFIKHAFETGVEASKKMAENDLARMEKYKSLIIKVGKAKQMEPAVIAGIISRETRANPALLSKEGFEPEGNGFGLMQVGLRSRSYSIFFLYIFIYCVWLGTGEQKYLHTGKVERFRLKLTLLVNSNIKMLTLKYDLFLGVNCFCFSG